MKAELLANRRIVLSNGAFANIRVWRVPTPVLGSQHSYKYSLAYVVDDECVLRYDNERSKGDHKHSPDGELPLVFTDIQTLTRSFFKEIDQWQR